MLFIHSSRYQWHNDDPYYDGVPMINRFQIPYLEEVGYVNMRCAWVLGCPEEIHPLTDSDVDAVHAGAYYMNGFQALFPGAKVPDAVGVSCCAQFGVARWKILERPKSDYQRYKKWLLETDLDDAMSGRIMEYSWHSTPLSLSLEKIEANITSDLWNGANPLPRRRRMLLQSLGAMRPGLLTMGLPRSIYPASLFKPARGMAIYRMEWRTTGSHCTRRPRNYFLGLSCIENFQHLQIRNDILVI
jgi:hypothetical protein